MESSSEQLRKRVEAVLDMALTTVSSLSELYKSDAPAVDFVEETDRVAEKEKASITIIEEASEFPVLEEPAAEEKEEDEKPIEENAGGRKEEAPTVTEEANEKKIESVPKTSPNVSEGNEDSGGDGEGGDDEGDASEEDDGVLQVHD